MKTAKLSVVITVVGLFAILGFGAGPSLATGGKPLAGYSVLAVEKFVVEKNGATEEFPKGHELLLQQGSIERLRKQKVFAEVQDVTEAPASGVSASPSSADSGKRLLLAGTVISYDKGSRAGRWLVGLGAGATKVKVRFTFRDAETGAEVFRTDRQGKFYGTFSFVGGDKSHAVSEAAGDVVDGLIKDIAKNR